MIVPSKPVAVWFWELLRAERKDDTMCNFMRLTFQINYNLYFFFMVVSLGPRQSCLLKKVIFKHWLCGWQMEKLNSLLQQKFRWSSVRCSRVWLQLEQSANLMKDCRCVLRTQSLHCVFYVFVSFVSLALSEQLKFAKIYLQVICISEGTKCIWFFELKTESTRTLYEWRYNS